MLRRLVDSSVYDESARFADAEQYAAHVERVVGDALPGLLVRRSLLDERVRPMIEQRVAVGCESIDAMLGGGLPCNGIVELYGPPGAGKTQVCLQLAASVVSRSPTARVAFIQAGGAFPVERLRDMLGAALQYTVGDEAQREARVQDALSRVWIATPSTVAALLYVLHDQLPHVMQHGVQVVVIDSIAALFRTSDDLVGDTRAGAPTGLHYYQQRAGDLQHVAGLLRALQGRFAPCATLVVNEVTSRPVGAGDVAATSAQLLAAAQPAADAVVPALGLAWSTAVKTRVSMARVRQSSNVRALVVDYSPFAPCGARASVRITLLGVVPVL